MQTFAPLTALPSVVLPVVCSLTQAFVSCGHSKPPTTGVHCPDSPHALHPQVFVPPHPLVSHWVAVARNAASPPPMFRAALAELGRLLIYEATRDWLPTLEGSVATPCGTAEVTFIDPGQPVKVVPILRAGLTLLESAATLLPSSQTFHVGYRRDEETLVATPYLNKLPASFTPEDRILVTDPMLATGGTMRQVIQDLVDRGAAPGMIRIVSAVCAPPALKLLADKFVGLKIYTGIIDAEVNEQGFIIPGLGDAGDRAFGT
uniref:uracil phosphoribosyltransferase n=1 Tax=Auxenochlorella protothecoides TaxID=3075 RepID=A0A1D2A0D3_AUXPR